ncbi:MAG: chemotaxis protein CheW [Pseudomonadota bacterium]|nr:chemotaxis protein CheW [Pseudomonadota bacterium]
MNAISPTLSPPATGDVVTFALSGEVLAVPAACLREVIEPVAVTRVPGASAFVPGIINVRGSVVPLADLRIPLRATDAARTEGGKFLVLELTLGGQDTIVGVIADAVHEVTRIEAGDLETIPPVGTRWPAQYVASVGRWSGKFVTLPNLTAIFADYLAGHLGHGTPHATHTDAPHDAETR